ncbi:MAG: DUF4349 domain-containing protein [Aureispira sp.]|nr:DUF4349 domain-containing protein [Aureispira sp.]
MKLRVSAIVGLLVLLLGLASCGDQGNDNNDTIPRQTLGDDQPVPSAPQPTPQNAGIAPKLIKEGHLTFQVDDCARFKATLSPILEKLNGVIAKEEQRNNQYQKRIDYTIRVPAEHFDQLLASLEKNQDIPEYKLVSLEDVTTQYIDAQTRLNTRKAVHKRYTELLTEAKTVEAIIQVEEAARKVQEEIESAEGQLKYLDSKVNFSTLYLSVYEQNPSSQKGFFARVAEAFNDGWHGFLAFLVGLAQAWLFILLFGLMAWFMYRKRKKKSLNSK